MRRLAANILLSIVLGTVLGALFNMPLLYYAPAVTSALVLSIWKRQFLYVILILFSAINLQLQHPETPEHGERDLLYSGIVVAEDHHEQYVRLLIHVDKIVMANDTVDYHSAVEYFTQGHDIFLGKRISMRGKINSSRYAHRPNVFSGRIVASSVAPNMLGRVFYSVRHYIDSQLRRLYRDEHYQVASGLVLGGSGRLAGELREVFARAGILHILAVSGLHVGFVGMFLGFLLLFVPLDYRMKFVVLMTGLFIYAGVTGFRPSVCRATVMAFLFGLAIVLQRNVDHIHVINITAIVFLLFNPLLILDISAQLSFAAVYGILYVYPKIDELIIRKAKRRLRYMLTPMAVSFSAQLFVAPLLIYYFRRLPIYAIFTNLLVVPIASVTIFFLFACFLMGLFWFAPVELVAVPVRLLISILIGLSQFVAGVPLSTINITVPLFLLLPLYLLLWAKARRFVAWGAIVVLSIFSVARSVDCLTVCIAAKSVLITVPSGASILVSTQKSTAQSVFLEKHGLSYPDYLIAADQYRPAGTCFVAIPDNMHFKRIVYDELELYLTKNLRIKFRGEEFEYDLNNLQEATEIGVTTYLLTNGHERHVVRGTLYCSIIEQLILDVQLVVARLKLLL